LTAGAFDSHEAVEYSDGKGYASALFDRPIAIIPEAVELLYTSTLLEASGVTVDTMAWTDQSYPVYPLGAIKAVVEANLTQPVVDAPVVSGGVLHRDVPWPWRATIQRAMLLGVTEEGTYYASPDVASSSASISLSSLHPLFFGPGWSFCTSFDLGGSVSYAANGKPVSNNAVFTGAQHHADVCVPLPAGRLSSIVLQAQLDGIDNRMHRLRFERTLEARALALSATVGDTVVFHVNENLLQGPAAMPSPLADVLPAETMFEWDLSSLSVLNEDWSSLTLVSGAQALLALHLGSALENALQVRVSLVGSSALATESALTISCRDAKAGMAYVLDPLDPGAAHSHRLFELPGNCDQVRLVITDAVLTAVAITPMGVDYTL
jgi:hypothetical protein